MFTPSEASAIDKRLEDVFEEEMERLSQTSEDDVEPIAVVVPLGPDEFHQVFLDVYQAVSDGAEYLVGYGYALATEYMMNDEIEASSKCSSAYHYFATGEEEDEEDE